MINALKVSERNSFNKRNNLRLLKALADPDFDGFVKPVNVVGIGDTVKSVNDIITIMKSIQLNRFEKYLTVPNPNIIITISKKKIIDNKNDIASIAFARSVC
jgi:hypothetical protein